MPRVGLGLEAEEKRALTKRKRNGGVYSAPPPFRLDRDRASASDMEGVIGIAPALPSSTRSGGAIPAITICIARVANNGVEHVSRRGRRATGSARGA